VVRSVTGGGLAGVCVTATGAAGTGLALSTAGGRYAVGGLPAGRYQVSYRYCARPDAYLSHWYGGTAARLSRAARWPACGGQPGSAR